MTVFNFDNFDFEISMDELMSEDPRKIKNLLKMLRFVDEHKMDKKEDDFLKKILNTDLGKDCGFEIMCGESLKDLNLVGTSPIFDEEIEDIDLEILDLFSFVSKNKDKSEENNDSYTSYDKYIEESDEDLDMIDFDALGVTKEDIDPGKVFTPDPHNLKKEEKIRKKAKAKRKKMKDKDEAEGINNILGEILEQMNEKTLEDKRNEEDIGDNFEVMYMILP